MSTQHNTGSRRRFLKTVGGTAVIGTLAGCLGGDSGSGDDRTITHIGFGGRGQESVEEKMREFGETRDEDVTVQSQTVTNNIELLNLISENPSEFDISSAVAINGIILHELQHDGELFTEVDLDRIPNYTENLQEDWRSPESNPLMVDNPWGVMHFISLQGCTYDASALDFTPTTWDAMKREELKGQVTHFDAGLTRYVQSAAAIGASPAEGLQDDAVYEEIWDEARRQDEFVETYWASADEQVRLYREESAVIGEAWGGQVQDLQEDDLDFRYWTPEGGVYPGGATWCIVDESDNKDFLYDYLDWVYQRENATELSAESAVPIPIKDPPEEITSIPNYLDSPDVFLDVDLWSVVPAAQQLGQKWAEVKA